MVLDPFDLSQPDRRGEIGHPIIVANNRKPIAAVEVHSLAPKQAQASGKRVVVCRDHPAFAGSDDLVAEEAEHTTSSQSADATPAVTRSHSLGSIFNDRQAMLLGNRYDAIH